jgi:DNA mismatch endonuclease, patch repair protein
VRADVLFRRDRVAVFVDGCFWHRCPDHGVMPTTNRDYWEAKLERNISRDQRNDELLSAVGWTVVRVWEHENPKVAAHRIAQIIRTARERTTREPGDGSETG